MRKIELNEKKIQRLFTLYEKHLDKWEKGELGPKRWEHEGLSDICSLSLAKGQRYRALLSIAQFFKAATTIEAVSYSKVVLRKTGFSAESNRSRTSILLDQERNVIVQVAENICGNLIYPLRELNLPYNSDGSELREGQLFENIWFTSRKRDDSYSYDFASSEIVLDIDLQRYNIEESGLPEILIFPEMDKFKLDNNPWSHKGYLVYSNNELYYLNFESIDKYIKSCFPEYHFKCDYSFLKDGIQVIGRCVDCKDAGYLKKSDVILNAKFGMDLKLLSHEIGFGKPFSIK